MPRNRFPLLLLFVVIVAGGVGTLWYGLTGGETVEEASGGARVGDAAIPPPAKLTARKATTRAETRDATTDARSAIDEKEFTERFDLDTARWVEGRVEVPLGSPTDETLEVVALGESLSVVDTTTKFVLLTEGKSSREQDNREILARRPVERDGTFRLPFPATARTALIDIDGRFLYLREAVRLDREGWPEHVTLEPELGAAMTGSIAPPPGVDAPGEISISLTGWSLETRAFGRNTNRVEWLENELEFELRGLPATVNYFLQVDPQVFPVYSQNLVEVAPGEVTRVECELELGARISGRVVDGTGEPLEGVDIAPMSSYTLTARRPGVRRSTSDASGAFQLAGLTAAETVIVATREGFLAHESESLELQNGTVLEDFEVRMDAGHSISGIVQWPDGSPASGAAIEIRGIAPDLRAIRRATIDGKKTPTCAADTEGRFRISGLGEGPFGVLASLEKPGTEKGHVFPWTAFLEDVAPDSHEILLTLAEPLQVTGRVLDDTGSPVRRFTLQLTEMSSDPIVSRRSEKRGPFRGEQGEFVAAGLRPGSWTLVASAKDHTDSEALQITMPGAGPLTVTLERSCLLEGLVLAPGGAPVPDARIRLSSDDMPIPTSNQATGEDGAFTLRGVPSGAISVTAHSDAFASSDPVHLDLVPGQTVSGLSLAMRSGGSISGEVFDTLGAPASERTIQVSGEDHRTTNTDESGQFLVEHLTPGTYQVIAMPDPTKLAKRMEKDPEDVGDILSDLRIKTVEVVEGETTHILLGEAAEDPVHLLGRVTQRGAPIPRVMVMVIGEVGAMLDSMRMDQSDEDGEFELTLNEPGNYTFLVTREFDGDGAGVEFNETIPQAETHRIELELPVASIGGTVFGPDGSPLGGIPVNLVREDAVTSLSYMLGGSGNVVTGDDGRYTFDTLHTGTYSVAAGGEMTVRGSALGRVVRSGITLGENEDVAGIDLELSYPGEVVGTVVDPTGAPVSGARIFIRDAWGQVLNSYASVTSDRAGRFAWGGASPGIVTVSARSAAQSSLESGPIEVIEDSQVDVELILEPGTNLVLTLVDEKGDPVRAHISVLDEAGLEVGFPSEVDVDAMMARGISSTEVRIGPLAPGEYKVIATTPDGLSAAKPVKLAGQEERKVKLRLRD